MTTVLDPARWAFLRLAPRRMFKNFLYFFFFFFFPKFGNDVHEPEFFCVASCPWPTFFFFSFIEFDGFDCCVQKFPIDCIPFIGFLELNEMPVSCRVEARNFSKLH